MNVVTQLVMMSNLFSSFIALNDLVEGSSASIMVDNNTALFLDSVKMIIWKV